MDTPDRPKKRDGAGKQQVFEAVTIVFLAISSARGAAQNQVDARGSSGVSMAPVRAAGVHSHRLNVAPQDMDMFYVLTRRASMPEYIGTGK